MAEVLSGQVSRNFGSNNAHCIGVRWSATQNATNLTSTITFTVFYKLNNSYGSIHKGSVASDVSIIVNGTTYTGSGKIGNVDTPGTTKDLWSKQITLTHASNGTLSFTLNGTVEIAATISGTYYSALYCGSTTTFQVKSIQVNPKFKSSTISTIDHKTLRLSFTADQTITKMEYCYKKASDSKYSSWKSKTISSASGSVDITGLAIGTSYSAQIRITNSAGRTATSGVKTASTYSAPTASGLGNLTLNNAATSIQFKVANPANKAYIRAHLSVQYSSSNSNEVNNSILSVNLGAFTNNNNYTWSLTQSNVQTIAKALKATTGKIRIRLESFTASSYASNTKLKDTYSSWANVSLNTSTYSPVLNGTLTMTRDSQANSLFGNNHPNSIIQNQTVMRYSFSAASSRSSATITGYKIECINASSGTVITNKSISSAGSGDFGVVNFSGNIKFRLTVTDSFGLSASTTTSNFVSVAYTIPTLSVSVTRDSDNTGKATIKFSGSIANLNNINAIQTFTYQYKQITVDNPTGTYGSAVNITTAYYTIATSSSNGAIKQIDSVSSGIPLSGFAAGSNYIFKITIADKLTTTEIETSLSEGIPIVRILSNGQFSINGLPDLDLDDYKFFVHGNSYIYGSCKSDSGFYESSLEELKTGISKYDKDPYDVIENSDIYQYYLKSSLAQGDTKERIGFVIGEDYKLDDSILSFNKTEIDIYSCIGILWKGEQKLIQQVRDLIEENIKLKSMIENYQIQNKGIM